MITQFTSLMVTLAILLFLLGLPFSGREEAAALRRAAAFLFIVAFVPPLLACVVRPVLKEFHYQAPTATVELVLAAIGVVAILVVMVLATYGFLDLGKHAKTRQPRPHGGVSYTKRHPRNHSGGHHRHDDDDEDVS